MRVMSFAGVGDRRRIVRIIRQIEAMGDMPFGVQQIQAIGSHDGEQSSLCPFGRKMLIYEKRRVCDPASHIRVGTPSGGLR